FKCSIPKIRVRVATIFAPSWRKRCSTMPDTSGDDWAVFFKAGPRCSGSGDTTRVLLRRHPEEREKASYPAIGVLKHDDGKFCAASGIMAHAAFALCASIGRT